MSWILKITFGKSRSTLYEAATKLAQSLPNYSVEDDIITCGAKTIREYAMYNMAFKELIQLVERWKSNGTI